MGIRILIFLFDTDPYPGSQNNADPHNTARYYRTTRMLQKLFVKYVKHANTFLEVL
jgi:hypothetical protein